jgi:hypothetical protein
MDTVQRPYPGVELLVWYLVLQPIQAMLPEVNIHIFLQLPGARAGRTARLVFQYDFKIVWVAKYHTCADKPPFLPTPLHVDRWSSWG